MASGFRSGSTLLLLAMLLATGGFVPASAPPSEEPLRNEDVVRRFVSGVSPAELVEWIRSHEVAFDLDGEVVAELREAALPDRVIEAMKRRQAEMASSLEVDPDWPMLTVHLNPTKETRRRLGILDRVDPQLAAELELGNRPDERRFGDLAIFLACLTPHHVPDHWRDESPLGGDFISMPRHRVLAFVSGARWGKAGVLRQLGLRPSVDPTVRGDDVGGVAAMRVGPEDDTVGELVLEIPRTIDARLEPDETHRLMLGIAAKTGGRYYRCADDALAVVTLSHQDLELKATLPTGTRRFSSMRVRFESEGTGRRGGKAEGREPRR